MLRFMEFRADCRRIPKLDIFSALTPVAQLLGSVAELEPASCVIRQAQHVCQDAQLAAVSKLPYPIGRLVRN